MLRHVVSYKLTDVSEVHIAAIIGAVNTSETSDNFYKTTQRNIRQDGHLHILRREKLKSQISGKCWNSTFKQVTELEMRN
jgi:hypothetical protein